MIMQNAKDEEFMVGNVHSISRGPMQQQSQRHTIHQNLTQVREFSKALMDSSFVLDKKGDPAAV